MEKKVVMTEQTINVKSAYFPPKISCITIDNEISLALESTPPTGSGENTSMNYYKQEDPFKINQV